MLTITVQRFEQLSLEDSIETHWLGFYLHDDEPVAAFMQKTDAGPWQVIDIPHSLKHSVQLLREFIDVLQIKGAAVLVTPRGTHR